MASKYSFTLLCCGAMCSLPAGCESGHGTKPAAEIQSVNPDARPEPLLGTKTQETDAQPPVAEIPVGDKVPGELPASPFRGMYVSLYTNRAGKIPFTGDDEVYAHILSDKVKEDRLLEFIKSQHIDSISLYDLNAILTDDRLKSALASFTSRARQAGVQRIEAIGAEDAAAWDRIHQFHHKHARFDGLLTEMEFWTGSPTFDDFLKTLRYVRSLTWQPASAGPPTLSAYLGRPTPTQVEQMVPLLDRVYIHVYVPAASRAFGYGSERFRLFDQANQKLGAHIDVAPIFSAEGQEFTAGGECFMGDWLREHGLEETEQLFLADWDREMSDVSLRLAGHQYYEYCFLDKYLKSED